MFSRLHSFRLQSSRVVAALLAAFLVVVGVQASALAATARSVSISASPAVAAVGTSVTFSGKLSKSPRGTTVLIQRKSGSSWVRAGSTRTVTSSGSYALRLARPKSIGSYSYRAYVAAKGSLKTAISKAITVSALKTTYASLSATPSSLTAGSPTTLAGTVFPFVAGTVVTLQWKSGSTWINLATTSITSNGTFAKSVTPSTSTIYRALVPRAGSYAPVISNERNVVAKPLITTTSLPAGTRLAAYTKTLTTYANQSGTWTASPLPAGLTLNQNTGVISGTPTTLGDTNVVVGFTQIGTGLAAANKTLTLRINQATAPTISTTTLPNGTVGSAYTTTLTATGNPTGTWTASPLPAGLSLDASTGVISGTPTGAETKQVVIGFTQTNTGLAASPKTIALQIDNAPAPVISTSSLPSGSIAVAYSTTLTVVGNPAGTWTASPLPAGLSLNASTGVISGSPTTAGDTNVVIGFTRTSDSIAATPKTLLLQVDPGPNPVISTSSLPDGTRLSSYTTTLTANGNPTGTWSASPLPAGLTLNTSTGTISGTPTAVGDTQVVIGFHQTNNGLDATPKTLNLHVAEAASPVISTTSLPDANRFVAYTTTLTATGDPAGTWTASPLPAGLVLDTNTGTISGTPSAAGDTQVVIGFTQTSTGLAATPKTLNLHVIEAPAPVISTANLPDGARLSPYTTTLTATGNPPGTWTASPLPAGLSLDASTGTISGTPTAVSTTQVVIGFTQTSTGLAATPKTLTLTINEASPPVISTVGLPDGLRFHAYTTTLTANGDPVGTWTASPLPVGLTLDPATGTISGTPRNAGDTSVVIGFTQTNTGLAATSKTLVLHVVQSNPVITTPSTLPNATVLASYSFQLQVSPAPVGTWKLVSGATPVGISVHTNGVISGSTPLPANSTFTVRFTETSTGLSTEKTFTLKAS